MSVAKGKIAAEGLAIGPVNNTALKVDRVTGQVDFAIGTPTALVAGVFPALGAPTYSTLPSTGIDATTKNVDAANILNNWLSTYLLDSPPAPAITTTSVDTSKITINFTPPPQKITAFTDATIPNIQNLKADVVASSLNAAKDWAHGSKQTFTLQSPATTAFLTVTALELYVQAGTSALSGTTYQARSITTEVAYDIRIYGLNRSTQATKYAYALNLATLSVGSPAAPTGLTVTAPTTTSFATSWTAPADRDVNTAGVQSTPYVSNYKVSRSSTSSVRYGGVITDAGDSITSTTTVSDSASSLSITSLNPGTLYSFIVAAKNTINAAYGAASSPAVTNTTSFPTAPSYLATGDASTLDATSLATIRGTYSSSGAYTLDGTALVTPVVNYNLLTDTNLKVTQVTSKRTNFTEGATGTVGSLVAYGGPTSTYTSAANTATFSVQGLGTTSPDGTVTSSGGMTRLSYSGDNDFYSASSTNNQGFYKAISMQAQGYGVTTNFPASQSSYSLRMQYTPVGGTQVQSTQVTFYVDNLNAASAVSNLGVIAETNSAVKTISGVPGFDSTASFKTQWCQTNAAAYFLRYDKSHAGVLVSTSGGTTIGSTVTVKASDMGGLHKYYTAPASNKYTTSSTLHNTSGLVIAASSSPAELQFNDFTFPLTAASNLFDENVQVKATPYSIYTNSGGTQVAAGYVDPATGTSKLIRIDTKSVAADRSGSFNATSSLGQHVSSGTGTAPTTYGSAYDHTQLLTANSDLQLVNGVYQTPAFSANGYKSYTGFWTSGASMPDYSTISSSASTVRYLTFKYSNFITSSTYGKVVVTVTHSGLSLSVSGATSNHTLQLKIVDSNNTYSSGWMNCNGAVSGVGIGAGSDGTANGDVSSTVGTRNLYILSGSGSTCTAYVRLGLAQNVAASVTSVNLAAVTSF